LFSKEKEFVSIHEKWILVSLDFLNDCKDLVDAGPSRAWHGSACGTQGCYFLGREGDVDEVVLISFSP